MPAPWDVLRQLLHMGGVNPLKTPTGPPDPATLGESLGIPMDTPVRQNFMFPEPGTNNFFGRHPRLTGGIENAFLGLANLQQGETTGENISNVARALLSIRPARQRYTMEQMLVPLQWGEMQAKMAQTQASTDKDLADAERAKAEGRLAGVKADAWGHVGGTQVSNDIEGQINDGGPLAHYSAGLKASMRARAKAIDQMPDPEARAAAHQRLYNDAQEQFTREQNLDQRDTNAALAHVNERATLVAAGLVPEGQDKQFPSKKAAEAYLKKAQEGKVDLASVLATIMKPGAMTDIQKQYAGRQEDYYKSRMKPLEDALKDPFTSFMEAQMSGTAPQGVSTPEQYGQYLQKESEALRSSWTAYNPALGLSFEQFHNMRANQPTKVPMYNPKTGKLE